MNFDYNHHSPTPGEGVFFCLELYKIILLYCFVCLLLRHGFIMIALPGLELIMQTRLVLKLKSAGIKCWGILF